MLGNGEMVARLLLAAAMGSVIGFERERLLWAAGLRTHMLVCVGACLAMLVSAYGFSEVLDQKNVSFDPSRVASQVISGIGFLGAGTILLRGEAVKGLTTAASLWAAAAIGLAVGGGLYVPAAAATILVIAILAGVKPLEKRWRERLRTRELHLTVEAGRLTIDALRDVTGERSAQIRHFAVRPGEEKGLEEVRLAFEHLPQASVDEIARRLRETPAVKSVRPGPEG